MVKGLIFLKKKLKYQQRFVLTKECQSKSSCQGKGNWTNL